MAKQDNTIYWIIGIVIFLIVATSVPFKFPFAVVQQTVCAEGVTNYYSLDGNLLDSKGNIDLINHGAIFRAGKINQGIKFNGTNYISFPTALSGNVGMWINNYSNTRGWYYALYINGSNVDSTKLIIPLSSTFGLGLNGSVDEIVIGTNISGLSNIQPCYQTTTYENVTCREYFESTLTDNLTGSLNVVGNFYPNCTSSWKNAQYKIINNQCSKSFFYQSSCLTSSGCYLTLTQCNAELNALNTAAPVITSAEKAPVPGTGLNKEMFKIGTYSIKLVHLIILLVIVMALIYFSRK